MGSTGKAGWLNHRPDRQAMFWSKFCLTVPFKQHKERYSVPTGYEFGFSLTVGHKYGSHLGFHVGTLIIPPLISDSLMHRLTCSKVKITDLQAHLHGFHALLQGIAVLEGNTK